MSSLSSVSLMSFAKALTDSKEDKSTILTRTLSLPVSAMMSFAASVALCSSRQAKMTLAPLLAKSKAVPLPIPVFAPVTIAVLPTRKQLSQHKASANYRPAIVLEIKPQQVKE